MKPKTTTKSQDHSGKQFLKDMEKAFDKMAEIFNFKTEKEKPLEKMKPANLSFLKNQDEKDS